MQSEKNAHFGSCIKYTFTAIIIFKACHWNLCPCKFRGKTLKWTVYHTALCCPDVYSTTTRAKTDVVWLLASTFHQLNALIEWETTSGRDGPGVNILASVMESAPMRYATEKSKNTSQHNHWLFKATGMLWYQYKSPVAIVWLSIKLPLNVLPSLWN